MRLNMRPEPHAQLRRGIEHELAIAAQDGSVQDDGGCLHVLQSPAEEVVFESCLRGLREEGGGVVGWC